MEVGAGVGAAVAIPQNSRVERISFLIISDVSVGGVFGLEPDPVRLRGTRDCCIRQQARQDECLERDKSPI
ncbi:hypothetical protein AERO8C_140254 [Aeromonas veronii]|uniref:Uncharacterized protein n=1 Tax=Aeromonas veronii TaxID=654 RepID=A0A653KWN1_AERVE|nr:hypothetical protein AERO8C_140254 [Aeromonas veronii]